MAGRIPQQFIDDLLLRVDIVDVIEPRLPLKKAGKNLKACCPFHNEKTPSFTVSPDKQLYHCFGCRAKGTAVTFLMDYEGMSFVESIHELADMVGMAIPTTTYPASSVISKDIYELLDKVSQYYVHQLNTHPQKAIFLTYLKRRHLSAETTKQFKIGMAPSGWDNILKSFGGTDHDRRRLHEAGLVSKNSSGHHYDRFRNRLMFPICDRRGRIVGFGGRTLDDNDSPKYLNSPETKIFQKGSQLYGLFEARKSQSKLDQIIIVEGYMDVLALVDNGITNAVATLGTAMTANHLSQAMRIASEIVFCFDGDKAGQQAAWHAAETALPMLGGNNQFKFMLLANGDDPDSFLRQYGQNEFTDLVAQAKNYSDFFFDHLTNKIDMTSIDGRSRLVENAKSYLHKIPPTSAYRVMLEQQLAELAKISITELQRHLAKSMQAKTIIKPKTELKISPIQRAIAILLQHPSLYADIAIDKLGKIATMDMPDIKMLVELIETLHQKPNLNTAMLLERSRGSPHDKYWRQLAIQPLALSSDKLKHEISGIIDRFYRQASEKRHEQLTAKDFGHLTEEEIEELKSLNKLISS